MYRVDVDGGAYVVVPTAGYTWGILWYGAPCTECGRGAPGMPCHVGAGHTWAEVQAALAALERLAARLAYLRTVPHAHPPLLSYAPGSAHTLHGPCDGAGGA